MNENRDWVLAFSPLTTKEAKPSMEETGPVGGEKEGRTFRHPEEMKRQRHTTVAAAAGWRGGLQNLRARSWRSIQPKPIILCFLGLGCLDCDSRPVVSIGRAKLVNLFLSCRPGLFLPQKGIEGRLEAFSKT